MIGSEIPGQKKKGLDEPERKTLGLEGQGFLNFSKILEQVTTTRHREKGEATPRHLNWALVPAAAVLHTASAVFFGGPKVKHTKNMPKDACQILSKCRVRSIDYNFWTTS